MTSKTKRKDLFMGDDYWNESEKRITPFDFEDDTDGYAFLKSFNETKLQSNLESEEDIIGWDGRSMSASDAEAQSSYQSTPSSGGGAVTYSVQLGAGGATYTSSQLNSTSSADDLVTANSSGSLTEALMVSPPPAPLDASQLASEVAFLRRRLAEARLSAPPAAEAARQLTLGQPCPLELHRALAEKRTLLAETVRLGDGDAMLTVLLFLKRTLKKSLFLRELRDQPLACEQYVSYLRVRCCYSEAIDLLTMLGRSQEAAMLRYESAVRTRGVDQQLRALTSCLQTHFVSDPDLTLQAGLIRQQLDLIERQRPVEAADSVHEPTELVGKSVLTTLHHCCVRHYSEPPNHLASPAAIRERHQLSDKQYVWTALRARASLNAWPDVQALFTSKTWYSPGGKLRAVVPLESAVEVLHVFGASPDVLATYVAAVDGAEKRIALAKQHHCYRIVVDAYVAQRDRQALEQYRSSLQPQSPGHVYASDALRAATVRWKN